MTNIINEVAAILIYNGPSIKELIKEATDNGQKHICYNMKDVSVLEVETVLPYNTKILDKYFWDEENKLIKHLLIINDSEAVVFDKYREASILLKPIAKQNRIA